MASSAPFVFAAGEEDDALANYFTQTGTKQRERDCDGAVAQIHKIAYKVLYGDLSYTLEPTARAESTLSGAPGGAAAELKRRLEDAARHWARRFNWPAPPRSGPTRANDALPLGDAPGYCTPGGTGVSPPGPTGKPPVDVASTRNEIMCPQSVDPRTRNPGKKAMDIQGKAYRTYMKHVNDLNAINSVTTPWPGAAARPALGRRPYTNTTCWLCGTLIKYGRIGLSSSRTFPHYQCEHIFNPNNQNMTGKYVNKIPRWDASNDEWQKWLILTFREQGDLLLFYYFGPSHACCNEHKGDASLFTSGLQGRPAEFDRRAMRQVLIKIGKAVLDETNEDWNCDHMEGLDEELRNDYGSVVENWADQRVDNIQAEIVRHAEPCIRDIEAPHLATLRAVANLVDQNSGIKDKSVDKKFAKLPKESTEGSARMGKVKRTEAELRGAINTVAEVVSPGSGATPTFLSRRSPSILAEASAKLSPLPSPTPPTAGLFRKTRQKHTRVKRGRNRRRSRRRSRSGTRRRRRSRSRSTRTSGR